MVFLEIDSVILNEELDGRALLGSALRLVNFFRTPLGSDLLIGCRNDVASCRLALIPVMCGGMVKCRTPV